jgi:hypothetical protein
MRVSSVQRRYLVPRTFNVGPTRQLQELARSYAQVVVDEEWALMAQGRTSPQAWELLDEMTLRFENVEVRTKAEQVLSEKR